MASQDKGGIFYNQEVENVLGTVHNDLLAAQNRARADQQAILDEQAALEKAVNDERAKATKEQLEAERKLAEQKQKDLAALRADLPTLTGAMWGGQGQALRKSANYIKNNLDTGDNLIETIGIEKLEYVIKQIEEAAKAMQQSYKTTYQTGFDNNMSYNNRGEGDKDYYDFDDNRWLDVQNDLNAPDQFNPTINLQTGELDFGGGMSIQDWVTGQSQRNISMVEAYKAQGYAPTANKAWDLDGRPYLSGTRAYMQERVAQALDTVPQEINGTLRYHPWQLTAMDEHYAMYVAEQQANNEAVMDRERFYDSGPAAEINRQNAYDGFEQRWMEIFDREQRNKNRKKSSGSSGSNSGVNAQDFIDTATIGQMQENDAVKKTLYQNFYNTQMDPPFGYNTADFDEFYGIKGLTSNLGLPIDLTGNPTELAFFNIVPGDPSISVEAAALSKEGNMFVAYKGRINTSDPAEVRLNDDIMNSLGIQDIKQDKRPDITADIRVIPFGSRQWKNIVIEAGKRVARLKTDRTALKKAFKDIRGNDEAVYFYVGMMAFSNQTNSLFMEEIRADLKADGLTEAEIDSIATLATP